ncbi:MAG: hypothetical protein HQK76_20035 [Desulfobacterales bacterium]|nr:hypothetical protein [Desulfobacterales bacterium]
MNNKIQWQPISKLPTFTAFIDDWVKNLDEQYQTMLPAKDKPYLLDNYTVERIFKVIGEQKEDVWMWETQLEKWGKDKILSEQMKEVERLQKQVICIKELIDKILELAKYLKGNTIEKVMAKDDMELAMEFIMGKRKF